MSKVKFFYSGVTSGLKDRTRLKSFIATIFKTESRSLKSISYIFSNDRSVREMNKKYLNHDRYTDIITFDLSHRPKQIIAEVYISYDRIRKNASTYETTFKNELHRVIFHGALHLCGYNDDTEGQMRRMRAREDFYLRKYFG